MRPTIEARTTDAAPTDHSTARSTARPAKNHRTVDRVTTVLEQAATTPGGITLTELARALDAPKSSIHGLVQGLVAVGYLRESNGRLMIGPGVQALTGFLRIPALVRIARSRLEELARLSGETTMLGSRLGNHIVYQAEATSRREIRYVPTLHDRRPMGNTALGRIFLTELDEREINQVLASENTAIDRAELVTALAQIRQDGVAFNHGLSVPSLCSLSAPIRNAEGRLIAGITIAGPADRMEVQLDSLVGPLKAACAELSGGDAL